MIQRIQSVYIIIAMVLMVSLFLLFPIQISTKFSEVVPLFRYLNLIGFVMVLISLFLYKRRPLQIQLNRIVGLLLLVELLFFGFIMISQEAIDATFGVLLCIPLAIYFLIIANRSIKKDEDLVRSVDRLR